MKALAAAALALAVLAPFATGAGEAQEADLALERALAYLALQAATGEASEYTLEAVISAGQDPGLWPTPQLNLLDRLEVPAVGTVGDDPIREIHAVAQSGYDPASFQGRDLVAELKAGWERSNQGVGQAAFTVLGLHAAGIPATDATVQDALSLLQAGQSPDGGWACIGLPSPDCTGFALTALRAADGFQPRMEARAKLWLDGARHANGGYGNGGVVGGDPFNILGVASPAPTLTESNTQSTIWAVHGYRALGQSVPADVWSYLRSRQRPDGGFAWMDGDTVSDRWATTEVVAGWTRSFHDLPAYLDSHPVVPGRVDAGVSAAFAMPDPSLRAAWRILGGAPVSAPVEGNPAQLVFPVPGSVQMHVEAQGSGTHHRERFTVEVGNAPPVALALPEPPELPPALLGVAAEAADADGGVAPVEPAVPVPAPSPAAAEPAQGPAGSGQEPSRPDDGRPDPAGEASTDAAAGQAGPEKGAPSRDAPAVGAWLAGAALLAAARRKALRPGRR